MTALGWLTALLLLLAVLRLRRRLELVARAEHELRGPLTALLLAVESTAGARAVGPHVDRLRLALADLNAARSGRRSLPAPRSVDVDGLARATVDAFRPRARRAGRSLDHDGGAAPLAVRADHRRLGQALGNLVANALEHGRGPVRLRTRRQGDAVVLEVADAGPGFDGGAPPNRRAGHGRGLAIASSAVEDAGGRLHVSSCERGATVAVELPVAER